MVGSKAAALLGVLVISVSLAACGGSSGVSAGTYVKRICQAIAPFEKSLQSRANELNQSSIKSTAERKAAVQRLLSELSADTNTAVGKLKAAGAPNVKNGKTIAATFVNAFTELKTAFAKAAQSAASLPTTNAAAFKNATQALGTTIQSSMSGMGTSLSNLKTTDLDAAFKKEPACQSIGVA